MRTPLLDLAYEEQGPADGAPVVLLPGVGHNIPQEAPQATLRALQDLMAG